MLWKVFYKFFSYFKIKILEENQENSSPIQSKESFNSLLTISSGMNSPKSPKKMIHRFSINLIPLKSIALSGKPGKEKSYKEKINQYVLVKDLQK